MFYAKSIAVVGASPDARKLGHTILKNLIDGGFKGELYPINPKADEILGKKVYRNLIEIEGEVDLAVIVVPSKFVPSVLEDAGKKGIRNVVIITGGFREIGGEGEKLENELLEIAKKYGIRVIGPNCQGINNTHNSMCASWPLITKKGKIAIISQSGTVSAAFADWLEVENFGLSCFVSLGNKSDVNEVDLIEFFSNDENTKVISLYIEGVKDGRAFMNVAKECKKPIVVLKPGVTERGKKAVESHTKSMAGRDEVFEAACKQAKIIRARDFEEFYDFSKALAYLPKLDGNRVLIVTSSGGAAILAIDVLERHGFNVIYTPEELKEKLREVTPAHAILDNPIDLTGDANAEMYKDVIELSIELSQDYVDAILVVLGDPIEGASEVIEQCWNEKPIVVCYTGGGEVEREETKKMQSKEIPVFSTPERAAKALVALRWYYG